MKGAARSIQGGRSGRRAARWITSRLQYYSRVFAAVDRHLAGRVVDGMESMLAGGSMLILRRRARELARREQQRPAERGRWLTSDESRLLAALGALIVPSDDASPGANEADVVSALDRLLVRSASRRSLYARGLLGCDQWAWREHGRPFVELTAEQQLALLRWVDRVHARWATTGSTAGKLARRAVFLYQNARCPFFELFPRLVQDVLGAFYTSPASWAWLSYDGPPMPEGYPDLLERGSRARESLAGIVGDPRPSRADREAGAPAGGEIR